MFSNVSSSNTDKGDVSCEGAYYARIINGHCSTTGTAKPLVEFNDEDGSFVIEEKAFTDPPGTNFYMFKSNMMWNRTRFSVKTTGKATKEVSPFTSDRLQYYDVEINVVVKATSNWGCSLVRQPQGELTATNLRFVLDVATTVSNIFGAMSRRIDHKVTLTSCYMEVTNKMAKSSNQKFSFFSAEESKTEIVVNTGVFHYRQPDYFDAGTGWSDTTAMQGIIAHKYQGTRITL